MGEFDSGVEGVLGNEAPEREIEGAVAGADTVALALALQKAGQDPALSGNLGDYLVEQKRLVQLQIKHFDEERRLGIAAAKRKRYADYIRNGVYTGIALLVLGVLLAAAHMTLEAMSDHGLVVDDFTVPADFAARGITSQALAEDLASRVAAISAAQNSFSLSQSSSARADQAGSLRVQIPETGISIDELERFLHRWLGHETVVNGELREESGGQLSIVLHIAGDAPIVVNGSSADLDALMQTTAERTFATTQPGPYVIYLDGMNRPIEAYDAAVGLVQDPRFGGLRPETEGGIYGLIAGRDPDRRRGLSSARVAIDAAPHLMTSWMEAASASADLGHDQAAVDFQRKLLDLRRQEQPPGQRDSYPWVTARARINIDHATGNYRSLESDYEAANRRENPPLANRYAESATTAALLHDEITARHELILALAAASVGGTVLDARRDVPGFTYAIDASSAEPAERAELGRAVLDARWDVSTSAGDWAQALDAAKALVADGQAQKSEAERWAAQRPEFVIPMELALETQYRPRLAYAEAMTGDTASATALISQTPTDCYLCVRMRARIAAAAATAADAAGNPAAAASDAATANHWFSEAVRQAPDLPMAYYEWGQALLARGDLTGAAREFSLAHDRGPHFADPLKAWGDVLAKQGDFKQALAKYDEALKDAPDWAALKQARDAAAGRRN